LNPAMYCDYGQCHKGATVSDTVLYEKDSHVVTIAYNRPERMNAINGQMREELNAAWLRFRDDEDAWVAILTGTGRAFCAGADVREGGAAGTFAGTYWEKPTINSFESGLELFKPTIVGAIRMPQRLNWADAMELLLVGEAVSAERAKEMGLVWKLVPHDDLMSEARQLADRLCRSAPLAVRATKEVAVRTRHMPWVESVRFGETMRIVASNSDDAKEGRAAFRDKRTANWQGK